MLSFVRAERRVECPFSIAADYAARHLREFEEPTALAIRVPLRRRVHFGFSVHYAAIGTLRRQSAEIHLQWRAGTWWLPDFNGTLRFAIASVRETLLVLEGTYRPPFGMAGLIFDELIGRHIAAATAADLLARVGQALEADERAFRAAHPPAS